MGLDLSTNLGNIKLKNPVLVSSGTFGYAQEYKDLVDLEKLGAIVTKSITPKAKEGNPPPRIVETACGIINSIGLENVGLDRFIEEKLPFLKGLSVPIIVSIAGENIDDYLTMTERLNDEEISGIELNLSCPNVKSKNNLTFAQDKNEFSKIIKKVRGATSHTLIVKLSPNVTDIREIAQAAEAAGADAISLVNTFLATAIDIERQMPKLGNFTGGLSGPAIKPIALRMVYEVSEVVEISVIGQGGIMNAEDALEFLICGADAISVGTGNFIDPKIPLKIVEGIKGYMNRKKLKSLSEIIGSLKLRR